MRVALLIVSLSLLAQVHAGADTASIAGRVTDSDTSLGIANVSILVLDDQGSFVSGSSQTDANGDYVFSGLAAGDYFVRTSAFSVTPSYVDELYQDMACPNGTCDTAAGTPVTVSMSTAITDIDFALDRGGQIGGTVRQSDTSASIFDIQVQAFDEQGNFVGSANTDPSGAYTLSGLPSGSYFVRASSTSHAGELYSDLPCPNFFCTVTNGNPVPVITPNITADIDFVLDPAGDITGQIFDAFSGPGIPGVNIEASDNLGNFAGFATTNANGEFRITGLAPGDYFVRTNSDFAAEPYFDELYDDLPCPKRICDIATGTPVSVSASNATSIFFGLALRGDITGRITNSATGLGVADVFVQAYDDQGSFAAQAQTDSDGDYRVGNLTAGTYFVRTSGRDTPPTGYLDQLYQDIPCVFCDVTTGTPVMVVTGDSTTNIDFALEPAGIISGQVTDSATALVLPSVNVFVFDDQGNFASQGFSDSNGDYVISGLPAGDYFLSTNASLAVGSYFDEVHQDIRCDGFCNATFGTPVAVTGGNNTEIDFALDPAGQITGTVTDDMGMPIASAAVQVVNGQGDFVGRDFTDSNGEYRINSLPTADYFLTASASAHITELYQDLPCANFCDATVGTPVAVIEASTTPAIDFSLDLGGVITGTVTDPTAPLPNAQARVHDDQGRSLGSRSTDSEGNYRLEGLAAGDYFITVTSSTHVDALYQGITCFDAACIITNGTPVPVTLGNTTSGIDVALDLGGEITGTVTDGADALLDVTVQVYDDQGNPIGFSSFTDSGGAYRAGGLIGGDYFVVASQSQSNTELYQDVPCSDFNCTIIPGTPVPVTLGETSAGIDFVFEVGPVGEITGTVTDSATAAALPSVFVDAFDDLGRFVVSDVTDSNGDYRLTDLPAGEYFVRTSNSSYLDEVYQNLPCLNCEVTIGTPVTVTADNATPGIDFALGLGGEITGTVTADGAGLSNAQVRAFDNQGTFLGGGSTDGGGNYRVRGLGTGAYFVTATSALYVDEVYPGLSCVGFSCDVTAGTTVAVNAGNATADIDFTLELGGEISGTISTGGTVPEFGFVDLLDDQGNFAGFAVSDASGNYLLSGLPTGTYFVLASTPGSYVPEVYNNVPCPGASCQYTSGTPIAVTTGSQTTGINFALEVGGQIAGTVTDGAGGNPVREVAVTAYDDQNNFVGFGSTDGAGNYRISGLVSDEYFVEASPRSSLAPFGAQLYQGTLCPGSCGDITVGTPVLVTRPDTTPGIDFALQLQELIFSESFEDPNDEQKDFD